MHVCDNCAARFNETDAGLVVTSAGKAITKVCPACLDRVTTAKLVIERDPKTGDFAYGQYVALKMAVKTFGSYK